MNNFISRKHSRASESIITLTGSTGTVSPSTKLKHKNNLVELIG